MPHFLYNNVRTDQKISLPIRASGNLNVLARKPFFQRFTCRGKRASTYVGPCPPPRGILGPLKVRVWHYCCSCERLSQHSGLAMEALCTICSCPDPGATILSTSPHCLTFPEPLSRDNMFRYLILPSPVVYHF